MVGEVFDETDKTRRLVEASAWRVALFEADLEATVDFEAWLASDPRNGEAWRQVRAGWDRFGQDAMEPELIIARRDVLERVRRHKLNRLAGANRWRTGQAKIAACLFVVLMIGAAAFGAWRITKPDVYQTALGERRSVTLADGSQVELDSNSLLRVKLRPKSRALDLVRGQARFEVAHDTRRPFTVHAGDKTVVATGTSFNVDLIGAEVIVTLIDGRVSVLQDRGVHLPAFAATPPRQVVARLTPGEQLVAIPSTANRSSTGPAPPEPTLVVLEKVSIERAIAWQTGQLVFDNDPLAAVAQRVCRYTDQPIVVDKEVAGLRLSGVFNTGDLPTFIDAVQRVLPVAADTEADGTIHLRRRGS